MCHFKSFPILKGLKVHGIGIVQNKDIKNINYLLSFRL